MINAKCQLADLVSLTDLGIQFDTDTNRLQ